MAGKEQIEPVAHLLKSVFDRIGRRIHLFVHNHGECPHTPMGVCNQCQAALNQFEPLAAMNAFPRRFAAIGHYAAVQLNLVGVA